MTLESAITMSQLIDLGWEMHALSSCSQDTPVGTDGICSKRIANLLDSIADLALTESDHEAQRALRRIQIDLDFRPPADKMLGPLATPLRTHLLKTRETVTCEAQRRRLLNLRPLFETDVDRLIDAPLLVFNLPDDLAEVLPKEIALYLQEAARCIAAGFGLAACATVLLATEGVIRFYFERLTGCEPKRQDVYLAWNQMKAKLLDEVRAERVSCSEVLLDQMKQMGDLRNRIMHPNSLDALNSDYAFVVWQLCAELVQDIVADFREQDCL